MDNPEDDIWARWAKVELMMFNGIWLLHATRGHAAAFLASVAQEDLPGAEELARAAACYEQEVAVLHTATEYIPLEAAEGHCVIITRPEVCQALRRIVQEAKGHEVDAVGHVGGGRRRSCSSPVLGVPFPRGWSPPATTSLPRPGAASLCPGRIVLAW